MSVWEYMPMMTGVVFIFPYFMQRQPYLTSLMWFMYPTSSSLFHFALIGMSVWVYMPRMTGQGLYFPLYYAETAMPYIFEVISVSDILVVNWFNQSIDLLFGMSLLEHMPIMTVMVCIFPYFMKGRPYLPSLMWFLYLTSSSFYSLFHFALFRMNFWEHMRQWWVVWSKLSCILCRRNHTLHHWCDFCIQHPHRRFILCSLGWAFKNTCQWWLVCSKFSCILCSDGHTSHRWRDFCNWNPRRRFISFCSSGCTIKNTCQWWLVTVFFFLDFMQWRPYLT